MNDRNAMAVSVTNGNMNPKPPDLLPHCLFDVLGQAKRSGEFFFVPARLEISGPEVFCFPLGDSVSSASPLVRDLVTNDRDALWVRGRLPKVFGFAPLATANNWPIRMMEAAFVAIYSEKDDSIVGVPFVCAAEGLQAGLVFPESLCENAFAHRIAAAFWALLLADPDDLAEFQDHLYGAVPEYFFQEMEDQGRDFYGIENELTVYRAVGYDKAGFFEEFASHVILFDGLIVEPYAGHHGFVIGECRACLDCDGVGEEETGGVWRRCLNCSGSGQVSW